MDNKNVKKTNNENRKKYSLDKISKIIGIVALCTFVFGIVGTIISLAGLLLAIMSDNKQGKRKIGIILNSMALVLNILFMIVIIICFHNSFWNTFIHTNTSNKSSIYKQPSSISDIKSIDIKYNDNKEYIFITKDKITYGIKNENNNVESQTITDKNSINEVMNDVFNNYLKYLKDSHITNDTKWSLKVKTNSGGYCLISGKYNSDIPTWFTELVEKASQYKDVKQSDVNNNGDNDNDSKEHTYSANFDEYISLKYQKETYNIGNAFTLKFNGIKFDDGYSRSEESYQYSAIIVVDNNNIILPSIFNSPSYAIWSSNLSGRFKVIKVNDVYFLDSCIGTQNDGHFVFVFNSDGKALANYYDVTFTLDKTNKKYVIGDCLTPGQEDEVCSQKEYQILENNIN